MVFGFALLLRWVYFSYITKFHACEEILLLNPDSQRYVRIEQYLVGLSPAGEADLLFSGPGYGIFLGMDRLDLQIMPNDS
jgi:hypothetical protein